MELVAFVNPSGVVLATWPRGDAQAREMSALLGTLRLEELPAEAVAGLRRQIAQRGWVLLQPEVVKSLDLLGVLRPAGVPMG